MPGEPAASIGMPRELKMTHDVLPMSLPALSLHFAGCATAPCVLGGATPTTPELNETFCERSVVPPSSFQQQIALVLSNVWTRKEPVLRSIYNRTRPKTDEARILLSAMAFEALRASPLR